MRHSQALKHFSHPLVTKVRHSQFLKHFSHPPVTKSAILKSSNTSAIHQLPSAPFSSPKTLQPSISYQVRHSQVLKHFSHFHPPSTKTSTRPSSTKSSSLKLLHSPGVNDLPSSPSRHFTRLAVRDLPGYPLSSSAAYHLAR